MISGLWLRMPPKSARSRCRPGHTDRHRPPAGHRSAPRDRLRHREGVVAEVDLFRRRSSRTSGNRRSRRSGTCRSRPAPVAPDLVARAPCDPLELLGLAAQEEGRIASSSPAAADASVRSGPMFLASGPAASMPSHPRPRARRCSPCPAGPAPGRRRSSVAKNCGPPAREGPSAPGSRALPSFVLQQLRKIAKPEPRKCSLTSCILIGLRRSGLSEPYHFSASR